VIVVPEKDPRMGIDILPPAAGTATEHELLALSFNVHWNFNLTPKRLEQ
jgi:hypothetical protein